MSQPTRVLDIPQQSSLTRDELERITAFVDDSISENTRIAYRNGWNDFVRYCELRGFTALPAQATTVAAYISALAVRKPRTRSTAKKSASVPDRLTASTIASRLAAVCFAHDKRNLGTPNGENPGRSQLVQSTMAGIRRRLGTHQARKHPLTFELLAKVVDELPHDVAGLRDRALMLIGFAGAFRRSELVALDVEHISLKAAGMSIELV